VEHGQSALESFFEWLILHTKEKQQVHMVMASSDSFLTFELEKFIENSKYSTYILGHLDKCCAKEYWKTVVLKEHAQKLQDDLAPPTMIVFMMFVGGAYI